MKDILKVNIADLFFEKNLEKKLYDQGIETIENLWVLKRKELKNKKFTDAEIHQIEIKLQLMGIDLNCKVYSKMSHF